MQVSVRHKHKLSYQSMVKKMENALMHKDELHSRCSPRLEPLLPPSSDCPALGAYWRTPWVLVQASHTRNLLCMGEFISSLFCPDMLSRCGTWELRMLSGPLLSCGCYSTVLCLTLNFLSGIVLFVLSIIWQRIFMFCILSSYLTELVHYNKSN